MNPYAFKLALPSDAAQLAAMAGRYIENGLRPCWNTARLAWHIRHVESLVLTARTFRDDVAGFALMHYGDDTAHLNLLAVAPSHRRNGIARRLLLWLEETALVAGTFIIGLELRATNQSAYRFYRSLGYEDAGRVSGYYQGVEDAIRMVRDVRAGRAQHGERASNAP